MNLIQKKALRAKLRLQELAAMKKWQAQIEKALVANEAGQDKKATQLFIEADPLGKSFQKLRAERQALDRQLRPITHVDEAGKQFIYQHEGEVLHPYNDSEGHATIGVGHLLHLGPVTDADRKKWAGFTHEAAMALFDADLDRFEKAVRKVTKVAEAKGRRIGPNKYNALVSFTLNVGITNFTNSTMAKLLRQGATDGEVAAQFDRWHIPPAIIGRRNDERDLYLGQYGGNA